MAFMTLRYRMRACPMSIHSTKSSRRNPVVSQQTSVTGCTLIMILISLYEVPCLRFSTRQSQVHAIHPAHIRLYPLGHNMGVPTYTHNALHIPFAPAFTTQLPCLPSPNGWNRCSHSLITPVCFTLDYTAHASALSQSHCSTPPRHPTSALSQLHCLTPSRQAHCLSHAILLHSGLPSAKLYQVA